MKQKGELLTMLFERLAELKQGGLIPAYEEQVKIELALLYDILGEDVDEDHWEEIEAHM